GSSEPNGSPPLSVLNSQLFQEIFYSMELENRLASVVVDEAHMIYVWGRALLNYGIFQPSYGKLGAQLLFHKKKPILSISATCLPTTINDILTSLKLTNS
ncbi:hypothetical protein VP01_2992g1, partial [Puccinia sorghi]